MITRVYPVGDLVIPIMTGGMGGMMGGGNGNGMGMGQGGQGQGQAGWLARLIPNIPNKPRIKRGSENCSLTFQAFESLIFSI